MVEAARSRDLSLELVVAFLEVDEQAAENSGFAILGG
jgi:hypothetical protein